MDEQHEIDRLAEEVQALADPEEREAVTLSVEKGSGVLRIPFASARIVRDEFGRVASLVGPRGTTHIVRDEHGRATDVYDEREDIVPE